MWNKLKHALTDTEVLTKAVKKYTGIRNKTDKIEYPKRNPNIKREGPPVVTFTEISTLGELGNQLFQIAAVIGYARQYGMIPKFPYWYDKRSDSDYSELLKTPFDQTLKSKDLYDVERYEYMDLKFKEIPKFDTSVDLVGFFQSEKYFLHCADEIRALFTPNNEIQQYIHTKYAELLSNPNKVSVHLRTGKRAKLDFSGNTWATPEFVEAAMSYFDPNALYVIFSDKMEAAKEMLPPNRNYMFIENEKNYVDLFLMNEFSQFIVSPSTFGWWGAWLSKTPNPKVVIKGEWFDANGAKANWNDNSIVPESWIKI